MKNLRIVADNAIDRAALTASSTAGALVVSNLQEDSKGLVHRASGTSVSYSATFQTPERLSLAALLGNYSTDRVVRVRVTNEASARNALTNSQQFDAVAWAPGTGGTVSPNTVVAPDGTQTADAYTHGTSTGSFAYLAQTRSEDASKVWTYSVWAKVPVGAANLSLVLSSVGGAGASTLVGPAQPLTTAWQRLSFSVAAGQLVNTGSLGVGFSGSAGQVYHLWGAQLELGAVATSYFPTTSAPDTRPTGYIDSWQSYGYDSGSIAACAAPAVALRGFTDAQAASAYAHGGGSYACAWFPEMNALGLRVDIVDPNNKQGYIEAWRMVAGAYWSPKNNPDWGASAGIEDTSKSTRLLSGDLVTEIGTKSRSLDLPMNGMPAADRQALFDILRANGTAYPLFVSLFPEDADAAYERDHMLWAKLSTLSAMSMPSWGRFTNSVKLVGV